MLENCVVLDLKRQTAFDKFLSSAYLDSTLTQSTITLYIACWLQDYKHLWIA